MPDDPSASSERRRSRSACAPVALALLLAAVTASADPWAMPGDLALRSDIQLLADAGIISAPVNAWPLPWGALAADLDRSADRQTGDRLSDPGVLAAHARVLRRLNRIRSAEGIRPDFGASVRSRSIWLRTFEDTPREEAQLRAGAAWLGERFAVRAQLAWTSDEAPGHQRWRGDGSYVAATLGNQILSVGALDRWWGPAWDNTLILSSNARPVSGITLERNVALPFSSRWLSWIGAWNYSFFWGFLGSDREVSNARLMAFRAGFRPTPNVEIGLSRTAMWCGTGRPCGAKTVGNIIIGRDNQGIRGLSADDEPGDQMAAIDLRWQSPIGSGPWALYTQWVAEDEKDLRPSQFFGQIGAETWGTRERGLLAGQWRGHLEVSNTLAEFWQNTPTWNSAYENSIYRTGHRYKGRSMGAAVDGDSLAVSAGLVLVDTREATWHGLLRWARINGRGDGLGTDIRHSVSAEELRVHRVQLTHRRTLRAAGLELGQLQLGLGGERWRNRVSGRADTDLQAFLQWTGALPGS